MLADDILALEKEMPDGLEEQQGACRFCGQIRLLHTLGGAFGRKVHRSGYAALRLL